jgi:spermidine/putrescine transport system permease protein
MILPLYSVLNDMPKNYIYASYDLGERPFNTFLKIVIPYTKTALMSGVILVFLPALTTVAVPQFLNNSPGGFMIGDLIVDEGDQAATSAISMARASSLSLVISLVILLGFGIFTISAKGIGRYLKSRREKYE